MGVLTKILFLLAVGYQSGCNSDCESIRGIELHQRVASLSCADHSYGTPERARRCKQVQYALLGASDAVNMDTVNLPEPINNWTSLMMASYAGHDSLVRKLLDAGVDANMKDKCGWTALMFAVISAASSTCVIQLLLEHNADINLVKYHDHSALFMATANKKTKIVELLLENNANFRQRDIWGQSPITAGVYCYETERCIPEVIKVYLQFCHIRTDYAIINQALWTAVDHCCPTIISDLLNSGAHIHEMKKLLSRAENKTKLDHSSCRHCNCRNCDCVAVHAELKLYSINDEVTKSHCLTAEDIKLKKTNSRCASIHSLPLRLNTPELVLCIAILVIMLLFLSKYKRWFCRRGCGVWFSFAGWQCCQYQQTEKIQLEPGPPGPRSPQLPQSIDDKPNLPELDYLKVGKEELKIIQQVGTDWKRLADHLDFHYQVIKSIECEEHFKMEECCREMFRRWLDGRACQPVTWERLIKALNDAQLRAIVIKLTTILKP